jgi:transcriptional regulator with XRE-family HTH domain
MGAIKMITSHQLSFLSEILEGKPVPEDTLVYFRERLRDRLHSAILKAFAQRQSDGLRQKDLAERIHRTRAQITRWLSAASNITLDSISDLMVGLGMDFDEFPFTPIEETIAPSEHSGIESGEVVDRLLKTVTESPRIIGADLLAIKGLEQSEHLGGATKEVETLQRQMRRQSNTNDYTDEYRQRASGMNSGMLQ